MATLTDRLTLRLLDDAFVSDLLATQIGLAPLFGLTYRLEAGIVHQVALTRIRRRQFQIPLFQTVRTRGSDERQGANPERIRIDREQPRKGRLEFLDAEIEIEVTATIEDRATRVRQITATDLLTELGNPGNMVALRAALVAQYGAFVADRAIEKLHIESVEELARRGALSFRIESEPAPPFDPNDPANRRDLPLHFCIKVVPQLDPVLALRDAKLCRLLIEEERRSPDEVDGAEIRRPFLFLALFADSAAADDAIPGLTAAQIRTQVRDLFNREEMVAHFVAGV